MLYWSWASHVVFIVLKRRYVALYLFQSAQLNNLLRTFQTLLDLDIFSFLLIRLTFRALHVLESRKVLTAMCTGLWICHKLKYSLIIYVFYSKMPTISVNKEELFKGLGRRYSKILQGSYAFKISFVASS